MQVGALVGLYLLPGLALLRLLWPRDRALVLPARLALALGLSVALPPLLLLLFHLIGLPWGGWRRGSICLSLLVVWFGLETEIGDRINLPISNPQSPISNLDPASFALLGITLAALLVRLYAVRDLPLGCWAIRTTTR